MPKVLVIEDSDPLRNDIMEMLSFEEYEVLGAENGRIGVEIARETIPDLIICDIMMPELDGFGVLETLKSDERTVRIPFIFLTAKVGRPDVRHGMGLGADDYLTKPFGAEELIDAVNVRIDKQQAIANLISERIDAVNKNIITAMPHELRTPLNTIIGFSDMIISEIEQLEKDTIVDWARLINLAAHRLHRLVENYLLYVKLEIILREDDEVQRKRRAIVSNPPVTIHVYATNRAHDIGRLADLKLQLEADAPIHIEDEDLGTVVSELVTNAFKFSEQGESVEVETRIEGDFYVIEVRDNGIGMVPHQIEQIGVHKQFDRDVLEKQGTGMGLAVLKQLEQIYQGELKISNWDRGLIVSFKIPLAVQ